MMLRGDVEVKLGISTACLYPMETERALETLVPMGFQAYEVFFNTFRELEPDFVKHLRSLANGGEFVSIHPFTSGFETMLLFSSYRRRFEDTLEKYRRYFDAANQLGAKIFVLHGEREPERSTITEEEYFSRYVAIYRLGQEYGITVAQENVNRFRSECPLFIQRMRAALGEECAFVFDVKQAVRAGKDPYEMLCAMGEQLVHVHINDNTPQEDCLLPGRGIMDYERLRKMLQSFSYNSCILLEVYQKNFGELSEIMDAKTCLEHFF